MGIHASLDQSAPIVALPRILTVEEVADLMRIVRRIGRCIRVSRDVLLRWLEQGEAKSATRDRQ